LGFLVEEEVEEREEVQVNLDDVEVGTLVKKEARFDREDSDGTLWRG
jgi:hypothetical protein